MKKLLVLVLSLAMIFVFAAVSMAEATLSGEIDTGYLSKQAGDDDAVSEDWFFGKMTLSGKLGEDVTGTLVFKADNQDGVAVDESDVTFTEGFGTLKFGYYGWNNNYKDILDNLRGDVKSEFTSSASVKVAEGFTVGLGYAYKGSALNEVTGKVEDIDALYGVDFGYATDTLGVDVLFTNTYTDKTAKAEQQSVTGVQASYKLDAFKVYLQYETTTDDSLAEDPNVTIIGGTYDGDALYGRLEYDLTKTDDDATNAMGVRLGYKLADGAKIEFQTKENRAEAKETYLKLICAF